MKKVYVVSGADVQGEVMVMGVFSSMAKAKAWIRRYEDRCHDEDEMLMEGMNIQAHDIDPKATDYWPG